MKIKELIKELGKFNPENEVLFYSEEGLTNREGHPIQILDFNEISSVEAEKSRDTNNNPQLKFGKTEYSQPHILVDIISDL